ncbi:helix-turn-helix transcriptional regulator [Geobacillus thermodenitrificans]|uniref:helix-turn-helix transcriptional regulator n=1 Tax=Geobacillus thermodenitrificans TaxID=33940 RepID=UPI0012FC3662|nr:helix-turn-helix transcriptional regulator [Geobacillus thermodenitrificans]
MTLGEKIKKARIEAGLSQEQLSEKLGVSRSAVAKWESGKGLPDIDNLKNLSKPVVLVERQRSTSPSVTKE